MCRCDVAIGFVAGPFGVACMLLTLIGPALLLAASCRRPCCHRKPPSTTGGSYKRRGRDSHERGNQGSGRRTTDHPQGISTKVHRNHHVHMLAIWMYAAGCMLHMYAAQGFNTALTNISGSDGRNGVVETKPAKLTHVRKRQPLHASLSDKWCTPS